jgi:hypothetical protein
MKTLLIIGLAAALAFVLIQRDTAMRGAETRSGESTPSRAEETEAPAPASVVRMAKERGTSVDEMREQVGAALAESERFRLVGSVIQHLSDGHLLVNGRLLAKGQYGGTPELISLFGHPRSGVIADGADIECLGCPVGTYQYNTVDGATRTVHEVVFAPGEYGPLLGASTPVPKSGDWMHQRRALRLNEPTKP